MPRPNATIDDAIARFRAGDYRRAERSLKTILEREPANARALDLLGLTYLAGGRHAEAIAHLERAVASAPREASFREHLAEAYRRERRFDLASAECRFALSLDPGRSTALNLLGLVSLDAGAADAALEHFHAALHADSRNRDAMLNASVALNRTGQYEQARRVCEALLKMEPKHPLAWTNLGMSLKGIGELDLAARAFENAGEHPHACFNLGFIHLLRGDLARGLPLFETRKAILGIGKNLGRPEWNGGSQKSKTLLVIAEQGMGDTILMSRFFPTLGERFARVVVQVQPPLARLMAGAFPSVEIVTDIDEVRYDLWCAMMSLPHLLGVDALEKIPLEPWLGLKARAAAGHAAPAVGTAGSAALPAEGGAQHVEHSTRPLRVGLNWAGNPAYAYDAVRSTKLDSFATLFAVPGVAWVSLHKGHREHDADAYGLPQPLQHATDFGDTASVLEVLDLVISTETAIPNLSAAMGIPTCVMTSPDVDWRWRYWYPGVTVCSQTVVGNWFGAMAQALEVIRDMLAERHSAGADDMRSAA